MSATCVYKTTLTIVNRTGEILKGQGGLRWRLPPDSGQGTWAVTVEPILLKTVLRVPVNEGIAATAATATIPTMSAYSTRSWPSVSCHKSLKNVFIVYISFPNSP